MTPHPATTPFDPPVETAKAPTVLRRRPVRGAADAARGGVAVTLALLLHLGFFAAASAFGAAEHAPRLRAERHPPSVAEVVPLEGFVPPPAAEPPPAASPAPRVAAPRAAAPASPPVAPAPAPMADFTNLAGAFEGATTYAVASSRAVVGAVTGAMHAGGAGGSGTPGGTGTGGPGGAGTGQSARTVPSLSQPPQLVGAGGSCPWPSAAMAADLYQQRVTVRVVVGADGRIESARAASDPGHGFGAAAEACARGERFTAARDAGGQPVRATTNIRYRFQR